MEQSLIWSIATDRAVMAEAMHDVLTTDLRDEIARLTVPLTVLYARDPLVPNMEQTQQQYRDGYGVAPSVQLRPIDGALHFIMYDQPEQFAAEIEAFLE